MTRRIERLISAVTLGTMLAGLNAPARAYTLQYRDKDGVVPIRWPANPITIAFSTSLLSPPPNIKPGSDVLGAARRALARWAEAANIQFVEAFSSAQVMSPPGQGDGINLITVAAENAPVFGASDSPGRTRVFIDSGIINEADIAINPYLQFSTDGTFGTYDLEATFTHEIGHLLGLEHSGVAGAIMQPRQGKNGVYNLAAIASRTLSEDDRLGARALYGSRIGTGSISGSIVSAALGGGGGFGLAPVFGAQVWAEDALTGKVAASNITLPNGNYRIDGLTPGYYRLSAQPLNGPVAAADIATPTGSYAGLVATTPPFRTAEFTHGFSSTLFTIDANSSSAFSFDVNENPAPTLNPRMFGTGAELSTVAVPLEAGGVYTINAEGPGLDQVPATGITVTSPFVVVNQSSVAPQDFGTGNPAVKFELSVSRSAPEGNYSIRFQSGSGEVAYILGGLRISNGSATANPIDEARAFVTEHYLDFLNRAPDAAGLAYWTNQITQCAGDAACAQHKRIDVSAAFFIENEFQQTGYFIDRLYQTAFSRRPGYAEFTLDRQRVNAGAALETNKQLLLSDFVARPAFLVQYPASMTPEQYVDALNANIGGSLTSSERDALLSGMTSGAETRATVLGKIADNQAFQQREYNNAFVLMQYFGYLRRDIDRGGYDFWLNVLNNREPNNYRGMVCSFITSAEYQLRFGPILTHSNRECGP